MTSLASLCVAALVLATLIPANFAQKTKCYSVEDGKTYTMTLVGFHTMKSEPSVGVSKPCECAKKADAAGGVGFSVEGGTKCTVYSGYQPAEDLSSSVNIFIDKTAASSAVVKFTMGTDWTVIKKGVVYLTWDLSDVSDAVKEIQFQRKVGNELKLLKVKFGTDAFLLSRFQISSVKACQTERISYKLLDGDGKTLLEGANDNTFKVVKFLGKKTNGKLNVISTQRFPILCYITTDLKMTFPDAKEWCSDNRFYIYGSGYYGIKSMLFSNEGVWLNLTWKDRNLKYTWGQLRDQLVDKTSKLWASPFDISKKCVYVTNVKGVVMYNPSDCKKKYRVAAYTEFKVDEL